MEYEKENLKKLKNLEQTLMELLEKIDKEINQLDVEWLHLKNISEANNSTSVYPSQHKNILNNDISSQKNNTVLGNVKTLKTEVIDDTAINSARLNLSPLQQSDLSQGADEEFDSD